MLAKRRLVYFLVSCIHNIPKVTLFYFAFQSKLLSVQSSVSNDKTKPGPRTERVPNGTNRAGCGWWVSPSQSSCHAHDGFFYRLVAPWAFVFQLKSLLPLASTTCTAKCDCIHIIPVGILPQSSQRRIASYSPQSRLSQVS